MKKDSGLSKTIIKEIEEECKKYFKHATGCHDWTHVERVRKIALKMGEKEGADLEIIEAAAFLHDIARAEEIKKSGVFCHAEKSAEMAIEILKKYNLPDETEKNILNCILAHRHRNDHKPETIESKVLYDADKLDAIGAIGIGRAFLFAGGPGSQCLYTGNEQKLVKTGKDHCFTKEDSAILEYEFKLKKIKDKMLTKEGKKMAQERHEFMQEFFERFWQEVDGKI